MKNKDSYRCPFCDAPAEGEPDFRFHLLTNHLKSEFADFVLDELDEKQTVPA